MKLESIRKMLNPQSVAVIGATENPGYGQRLMSNLLKTKFPGKLYPVNPNYKEVFGVPCYPSIAAIGEPVDFAVVIVKAGLVEGVIEDCAKNKVGAALIITAGFSEFDKVKGSAREQKIREIARQSGTRLVGPNCVGLANVQQNLWATSISNIQSDMLPAGKAGLVSQSGATGFGPLLNTARDRRVGFKYIVTTGNEADLGLCDFIEYMLEDEEIECVAALIEGIKDGAAFVKVAQRAKELGKTLAVLKIGESEVGARAAASHTASMTGDMTVFNALCKQYGVLKADSYDELIEMSCIAQGDKKIAGKNVAVFSSSGGIAGLLGDKLGKYGFNIPVLSEKTQATINGFLKDFGSPRNPLDLTGQLRSKNVVDIARAVNEAEPIDIFVFTAQANEEGVKNEIAAANVIVDKPVYFIWTGSLYAKGLDVLRESNYPISFSLENFAKNLSRYVNAKLTTADEPVSAVADVKISYTKHGYLNEVDSKATVASLGIPIPKSQVVNEWNDSVKAAINCQGKKSYALKIVSDTIIHKSDMGGVVLGLKSIEEINKAFDGLQALKNSRSDIQSILLEEMCPEGLDLVLGVRIDEQYGPVLLVGLGGIYTELFKLTSCRLLPITRSEIERMLAEIPGLEKLLNGYRKQPAYDKCSLVGAIERISRFVHSNEDRIELVEINPLRVLPGNGGIQALDCVIKLK